MPAMPPVTRQADERPGGARALPAWPLQLGAAACIGLLLWLAYGGGYVTLDSMWAVVWGRDLVHGEALSVSGTTTPHVLSNLIGAVLTPLGAEADRGLVAIAYLSAGALVWCAACLAREIAGVAAGVVAAVLVAMREQLLYAATSNFLDVLTAALVVWAALLVIRAESDRRAGDGAGATEPGRERWGAAIVLFLAGLLRPEAWALAGALWLWTVARDRRPHRRRLALVFAAPACWLVTDALVSGDALFSVHETSRVNALVRAGSGIPDTLREHLISIPRSLASATGPEIIVLMLVLAAVVAWPALARRRPLTLIALPAEQLVAVRILLVGAVVFALVIAAEGITGSLLFARFSLGLMGVLVALTAVLLVAVARSVAGGSDEEPIGRRRGSILAGLVAVLALAQVPGLVDARRLTGEERDRYLVARAAISAGVPCTPVATPNVNMRAFVAAWLDLRGDEVVDAATDGVPARGTYVTAAGPQAEPLLRNASFPQLPAFPPAPAVRSDGGWVLTARCSG